MKDSKIDFRVRKIDKMKFKAAATRYGYRSVGEWFIKLGMEKLNERTDR